MNIGNLWTDDEEFQLTDEIQNNMSITDIAKQHGRTEKAIRMRLESMIRKKHWKENYTISTLSKLYNKTEDDIKSIIQTKDETQSKSYENKYKTEYSSEDITNIQSRLDKIEKLLSKILKKIDSK